jgi:PKD repeat protein
MAYIQLATYNRFTSPHFPNYRLGPLDGSPCDTLGLDNHPLAGFRFEVDNTGSPLLVAFIDNSFYEPTDWHWDFGDGSTSTEVNPWHTFPGSGTYTVCLTVSNQYDSDTVCREVTLIVSGVKESNKQMPITIFPNPTSKELNINLPTLDLSDATLTLYTPTAQPILTQHITAGWNVVPLEGITPGLYFYKVMDEGRLLGSGKLVKVE